MCLWFLLCTILEETGSFSFSFSLLVVPRFFPVKCFRSREFSHPTSEAFDLGCTFLRCSCCKPRQRRRLWMPRWGVRALSPNILSLWVQPVPNWVSVLNMKWMANHVPQPALREPELFGFLTLCSFQGRNGGGSAVKPNNPPSLCQPLDDKESQSLPIIRSFHIWKLLLLAFWELFVAFIKWVCSSLVS